MSGRDTKSPIDGAQAGEESRGSKAWFVYTKVPGRFSAAPASIEGWLVLLGLPALGLLIFFTVLPAIGLSPALFVVLSLLLLIAILVAIFVIARVRGRPFR